MERDRYWWGIIIILNDKVNEIRLMGTGIFIKRRTKVSIVT